MQQSEEKDEKNPEKDAYIMQVPKMKYPYHKSSPGQILIRIFCVKCKYRSDS